MFSLSHHAHIVVQVLRKPEEKDYGRQKTGFWGIYGQLALFRKQEKDVFFFQKERIKIETGVFFLYNVQRDKIAMVSQCSIVRG